MRGGLGLYQVNIYVDAIMSLSNRVFHISEPTPSEVNYTLAKVISLVRARVRPSSTMPRSMSS